MEAPHCPQEAPGTVRRYSMWYLHDGTGRTYCSHHLAYIEGAFDA